MSKVFAGLLFGTFLVGFGLLTQSAQVRPGGERYTPTKLEWLATYANATRLIEDGVTVYFIDHAETDTITIYVSYNPEKTDEAESKITLQRSRDSLEYLAKQRGWTWLTVEERIERLKPE